MLYYRPTTEKYDYFTGYTAIKGELLTEKERNRKFRYLDDCFFEVVNVNRNKTYWSFGCRWEIDKDFRYFNPIGIAPGMF